MLADALRPPFARESFDTVITPWLVDIVSEEFALLARRVNGLLRKGGRFGIIYPSVRTVDLLAAMRASDLEPKTLTPIPARMGSPAQLVAVMGTRGGRPGLDLTAPLTLYRDDGTYTPRLEAMLGA